MTDKLTENAIEQLAIELLERQGFRYLHGAELAPDAANPERASFGDVFLEGRLRDAVARLNPTIPADAREQAVKEVVRLAVETGSASELVTSNETFHRRKADRHRLGDPQSGDAWLAAAAIQRFAADGRFLRRPRR